MSTCQIWINPPQSNTFRPREKCWEGHLSTAHPATFPVGLSEVTRKGQQPIKGRQFLSVHNHSFLLSSPGQLRLPQQLYLGTKETKKLKVAREVKVFCLFVCFVFCFCWDGGGGARGEVESWRQEKDSLLQRFRRPGAQRRKPWNKEQKGQLPKSCQGCPQGQQPSRTPPKAGEATRSRRPACAGITVLEQKRNP